MSALAASCISENTVLAMMRGSLDGARRAEVTAHIDECAMCQELVALVSSGVMLGLGETENDSGPKDVEPRKLAPQSVVGRYRVRESIGAGAMGIVYLADDLDLNRRVALKMLRAQDDQARRRLQREAQALARVSHPNVIVVYEVGAYEGQVFMAMEYVEGGTLTSWLHEKRRSTREVLDVFAQAGRGLGVAHAAGLVHRDFKPDNVLVGRDGRVRVVDFGLARADALGAIGGDDARPSQAKGTLLTLTRTGAFVGTPAYMSPEQYDGQDAEVRSDQFAFCVALFEALYRTRPFDANSIDELAAVVRTGRVRKTSSSDVAREVERAILRGLRVRPDERFESMEALLEALVPPSRRIWPLVALAAAALLTAIAAFSLTKHEPPTIREPAASPTQNATSAAVDVPQVPPSAQASASTSPTSSVVPRQVTGLLAPQPAPTARPTRPISTHSSLPSATVKDRPAAPGLPAGPLMPTTP